MALRETAGVDLDRASSYGERHAAVYDTIYGLRFDPAAAVAAILAAADAGPVLELGAGPGRLAIPLARSGIVVDGIEASAAMRAALRAQPGGERVGLFAADLADFDLPRHDYAVAVCAVSTLFMLDHDAQRTSIRAAAQHLRPGGRLFIEAFRPDPTRFDQHGHRVEHRPPHNGTAHVVHSTHNPTERTIDIAHELTDHSGHSTTHAVTLYYRSTTEIDQIAHAAGLELVDRWHDWTARPAQPTTNDPITIYSARQ